MAVKDWVKELQSAEKEKITFVKDGRHAMSAYRGFNTEDAGSAAYEFNLYWANVAVLKSALYANPPKPMVTREFDDYMDQPARVAGIMMQRMLSQDLCTPGGGMDAAIELAVNDRLIPGIGQVWLRYDPTIEEYEMDGAEEPMSELTDEQVITDYVYWEDFFWSPARIWKEVWWVARRAYMTPKDVLERFGKEAAKEVNYSLHPSSSEADRTDLEPQNKTVKKAEIFEVWNKRNETVCFYAKGIEKPLDDVPDPLQIPGFWPCPPPLCANILNGNYMPRSDYQMVISQYARIEMLSRRIFLLEEAIRVAGVYDKANAELQQLLNESSLNKMIPVDNWAMLAEKGGLAGSVDWFPLVEVTNALQILRQEMPEAQKALYELTGLSDIMRGSTHPRETLGAQEMKASYSSTRLQYQQGEVGKFVAAILQIKASIISKHFSPITMIQRSNIMLTPDGEQAMEAVQILKDQWAMCYRLEVDTDQMAIPDYNAERQGRIEFITATGGFIAQVMPMLEKEPSSASFFMEILKWGVASFHGAVTIEGVFERATKELVKKAQQPPKPPPPDPALVKAQADAEAKKISTQAEIEADQQKAQATAQNQLLVTQAQTTATRERTQADIEQGWAKVRASIAQTNAKAAADVRAKAVKARSDK
jgi:hypothetical protein